MILQRLYKLILWVLYPISLICQKEALASTIQLWLLISVCPKIHLQYHANELMPLKDDQVVAKAVSYLSKCIKDFSTATVMDHKIRSFPKSLTHFFPGSLLWVLVAMRKKITMKARMPMETYACFHAMLV